MNVISSFVDLPIESRIHRESGSEGGVRGHNYSCFECMLEAVAIILTISSTSICACESHMQALDKPI